MSKKFLRRLLRDSAIALLFCIPLGFWTECNRVSRMKEMRDSGIILDMEIEKKSDTVGKIGYFVTVEDKSFRVHSVPFWVNDSSVVQVASFEGSLYYYDGYAKFNVLGFLLAVLGWDALSILLISIPTELLSSLFNGNKDNDRSESRYSQ